MFSSAAALAGDASSSKQPWQAAQELVDKANTEIKTGGIRAIELLVPELEQALASAPESGQVSGPDLGTVYLLTDGMAEALVASAEAAEIQKSAKEAKVEAVPDPYPVIGLYLGVYYDETGAPERALRALDASLALSAAHDPLGGGDLAAERPHLLSERGVALFSLKRWADALADYELGLKIADLEVGDHARLLRGRGFALTELGRLDEAEVSYRESLKLEPGSELARKELTYIAQLRATGISKPPEITLSKPPSKTQ